MQRGNDQLTLDAHEDADNFTRKPTAAAAFPSLIGNYAVDPTVLGVGNFATVRLGTHIPTGEKVALKLIEKKSLLPEDLSKIHREIAIAQALRHPHVIRTYQTVENGDHIAVVMEYASGGEMYGELTRRVRYDEPEARRLFRQTVAAVRYCHSLRVVHRDLKTENLLLDAQHNVKLADFGFSDVMKPGECFREEWCGSLPYAAPELFDGHSYDGFKCDAWSLGIVLYVMVTGALPFDGESHGETRERILAGRLAVPAYVSADCAALLRALLVVDPAARCDVESVLRHPWLQLTASDAISDGLSDNLLGNGLFDEHSAIADDSELNEYVLDEMDQLGYSRDQVRQSVQCAPYNDISVTYHLLNDRFIRNLPTDAAWALPAIPISRQSSRRSSILTGIVVRDELSPTRSSHLRKSSSSGAAFRRSSLPPASHRTPGLSESHSWPVGYRVRHSSSRELRRASDGSVTIPGKTRLESIRQDSGTSDHSFHSMSDCSLFKEMASLSMDDMYSDEEPDMEAVQRYLTVRGKATRHTVATSANKRTPGTSCTNFLNLLDPRFVQPGGPRRHSDNPGSSLSSRGRAARLAYTSSTRPVSPMDEMTHLKRHLDSGLGSPVFCFSPAIMSPQRLSLANTTGSGSPNLLAVPSAGTLPARLNAAFSSPSFLDKLYGGIRITVTPDDYEVSEGTGEEP